MFLLTEISKRYSCVIIGYERIDEMMNDSRMNDVGPIVGPDARMEEETFGSRSRIQQLSEMGRVRPNLQERYNADEGSRRLYRYHRGDMEDGIDRGQMYGALPQMRENIMRQLGVQGSLLYPGRRVREAQARPSGYLQDSDGGFDFAKYQKHVGSSIQIKHWQLRDLVRCPFQRDDVFVVKGFAIYRYDISNQKVVDRHGFLFEPTCFGFGDSFLGVAGEMSEYAVQHVSTSMHSIGHPLDMSLQHYGSLRTGSHVNNAIKITNDLEGRLSAYLCNNSGHLMVMTGVDNEGDMVVSESSSIFCPVSINHCAVAEKDRTLVYVGDSDEVFVCQPTSTGYQISCKFREASDAGMSCDWNSNGTSFAVASQDGLVCVWDIRQKRPAVRLSCQSAARCVKFSPNPLDLLAFTEHRNYLHLVDCRMWANRQVIKVRDDLTQDVDICGFDFSPCGSTLYVGTEDSIDILQINTGSRTSFPYAKLA